VIARELALARVRMCECEVAGKKGYMYVQEGCMDVYVCVWGGMHMDDDNNIQACNACRVHNAFVVVVVAPTATAMTAVRRHIIIMDILQSYTHTHNTHTYTQ